MGLAFYQAYVCWVITLLLAFLINYMDYGGVIVSLEGIDCSDIENAYLGYHS